MGQPGSAPQVDGPRGHVQWKLEHHEAGGAGEPNEALFKASDPLYPLRHLDE